MNMRVGLLAGMLLVSFVLGSVPSVAAQNAGCNAGLLTCATTTSIEITPVTQPVKPLGPFITVPITIKYLYTQTASVALAATPITLRVTNAPSWLVTTLSPTTVYAPVNQVAGAQGTGSNAQLEVVLPANLLVSATADAPAFTQGPIAIQADAADNGALTASSATNSFSVNADFFSIIEATTPQTIQRAKPQQQVTFPITVTNFGNAQTKVEFSTESVPDKWQASPPAPVQLAARQAGGTQNAKTANFNLQTPFQNGYLNVVGAVTIRLKSNYALDPKVIGDSTIISTLTTTKGFYVPGPEPALALMAIGMLAVGMRWVGRKPGG
jgi:hypothetical protein